MYLNYYRSVGRYSSLGGHRDLIGLFCMKNLIPMEKLQNLGAAWTPVPIPMH